MWYSFLTVFLTLLSLGDALPEFHKYCIIGAGPGGLQMAHYLQRAGLDYVLFERTQMPGSFFDLFPRHRTLISINKRHTGQTNTEFNLRHDWNSILSDDDSLLFTKYSREMFPDASILVKYLEDYVRKLNITVRYGQTIRNLKSVDDGHVMENTKGEQFKCKVVVLATGLSKTLVPDFEGREFCDTYISMNMDPDFYEGKNVLIVGRGNTGFEIANDLYGHTSSIHMMAGSRVRLSWETHYVGDVRGVNNALLDTYQLKSLDGIIEGRLENMKVVKENGKLFLLTDRDRNVPDTLDEQDNYALRFPYDHIILATGWTFDDGVFHSDFVAPRPEGKKRKYPLIRDDYSLADRKDTYVVGTASHSVDFRRSAGGFIHGFRYTGRAVFREMIWRHESVPWPAVELTMPSLLPYLTRRMNEASGNYQMFAVLGDVILPQKGGTSFKLLEEFPIATLPQLYNMTGHSVENGILVWLYEYGYKFSGAGKDIFRSNRAEGDPAMAYQSNFLHPTVYYYDTLPTENDFKMSSSKWPVLPKPKHVLHLVEDFTTLWTGSFTHLIPLRRLIERAIKQQVVTRQPHQCLLDGLSNTQMPAYCSSMYTKQREFPVRDR